MKYCCQKLEEFIKHSSDLCFDSIISERKGILYIAKNVRACDDGDNRIDEWIDEWQELSYCPFCGIKY